MSLVKWHCTIGTCSSKPRHVHSEETNICNLEVNWSTVYYTNEYPRKSHHFSFFFWACWILPDYIYASPYRKSSVNLLFLREFSWKKHGRKLCIATLIDQSISQPSSEKRVFVIDVINTKTLNWPIYKKENKRPQIQTVECSALNVMYISRCSPQSPGIFMEGETRR